MLRIGTSSAVTDLFGPGKPGFTDGDPVGGIPATWLNAAWFNAIQEAIANAIELAGETLDPSDHSQLFMAFAGGVQSGKWLYAVAGGTANALTATLTPAPVALIDGLTVHVRITTTNAGAVTLNLNALGMKNVQRADGSAIQSGDLVASATVAMTYNAAAGAWRCPPSLKSDVVKAAMTPPTLVRLTTPGAGTWVVPAGVEAVDVELWGGGGGGGYNASGGNAGPGGGAGGAYARRRFAVTPGQVINYTVGAGGLGGHWSPARVGQAGTASSVTVAGKTVTANGGAGALNPTTPESITTTPVGPTYSGADYGINGGSGGLGFGGASNRMYGGVGGASPLGGQSSGGGAGGLEAANAPGGAGGASSNSSTAGQAGAAGEVRITYVGA